MDPTREQWEQIATVVHARGLEVTFDCAYQGFATGDVDGDSFPIRLFVERGVNFQLIQSYAKVSLARVMCALVQCTCAVSFIVLCCIVSCRTLVCTESGSAV